MGRFWRRGAALIVAGVALGCVVVGWLDEARPIGATDAVAVARAAFRHAHLDAAVVDAAQPGVYQPVTGGGPVAVFRTSADVDGAPVVLYLRQSDAAPVYLDDRSAAGDSQVLSPTEFTRLVAGLDNPADHDLLVRNLLLTLAAAAILGVAVLSLTLDAPQEPS